MWEDDEDILKNKNLQLEEDRRCDLLKRGEM